MSSDKEILDIIWNCEEINQIKLYGLLYKLCDMSRYSHLGWFDYEDKICDIVHYMCTLLPFSFDVINSEMVTKDMIHDKLDVLPENSFICFVSAWANNHFIAIDYEDFDTVYGFDDMKSIIEKTGLEVLAIDDNILNQDSINKVIKFINNLDLFDIELYKMCNEV